MPLLHPRAPQKGTQSHSPSQTHIHFNCPLCPREKTYQSIAASVAVHEREAHSGREKAFLKTSGDRYKRHATRIDMVSVTSMATFTQTSAGSRVGAIEHPPRPYPRILMDWVASPLRENQPSPRLRQRKVPIRANSLDRANVCRGEYKMWWPMLDTLDGTTLARMSLFMAKTVRQEHRMPFARSLTHAPRILFKVAIL